MQYKTRKVSLLDLYLGYYIKGRFDGGGWVLRFLFYSRRHRLYIYNSCSPHTVLLQFRFSVLLHIYFFCFCVKGWVFHLLPNSNITILVYHKVCALHFFYTKAEILQTPHVSYKQLISRSDASDGRCIRTICAHITQLPPDSIEYMAAAVVSRGACIMHVLSVLVLVWCTFHVEAVPCPENCVCAPSLKVTCNLTKYEDYAALLALDPRTEALTCSVAKKLNESALNFDHFRDLKTLVLRSSKKYSNVEEAQRDGAISQFKRRKLFQNLTGLSYLGINVVTTGFDPVLLQNVPNIKTLDLSYSLMEPNTSKQILMWVNQNNFTIHTLLMIRTQLRSPVHPAPPIYIRDDIYKNVNNLPLKILDLSENVDIVMQVGVSVYLPQLEIGRVGGSHSLTYESHSHRYIEFLYFLIFDLTMHLSIRECALRFPGSQLKLSYHSGGESHIFSRLPLPLGSVAAEKTQDYNYTDNSMQIMKINFRQLFTRTSEIVDHGMDSQLEELGCVANYRFPLPKHLEIFTFVNDHSLISKDFFKRLTNKLLCFDPSNNLLYWDVSHCNIHLVIPDTFGIRGFNKLVYLNAQGTEITFKTTMSFFTDMKSLEVLLLGGNNVSLDRPEQLDFLHIQTLRVLDIQGCGIKYMPSHTLVGLKKLEVLNISENSLKEFNVNLTGLRNLKLLNLSGNSLHSLDKTVTFVIERVALRQNLTVDLSRNPLECSCSNISSGGYRPLE